MRGVALGRKSWLFCGSDRGGERAAVMYSLIVTAKMNDVDPQAWLAEVLARIAEHPVQRLDELLPWNWRKTNDLKAAAIEAVLIEETWARPGGLNIWPCLLLNRAHITTTETSKDLQLSK